MFVAEAPFDCDSDPAGAAVEEEPDPVSAVLVTVATALEGVTPLQYSELSAKAAEA